MARTAGSHSDITGPRIKEAALTLFAQHGYAAVSMRQIAKEVGVQAGALYNYTPDKQTLLFEAMRTHLVELLEACPTSTHAPSSDLESFVRFHIAFHRKRPNEVFIAYMELRNLTEANFAQIEALRRSYEERLELILKAGVQSGAFSVQDTRIMTRALIAMLNGVNTWYRTGGSLTLDDVLAVYWDMVLKSVSA
ncbi:MAG: TetR/AcrR family transcriptional regulator [Paracoccaceae bacterium]